MEQITLILALGFPALPTLPDPVFGECIRAIPLVAGELPSEDLIEPETFTVSCGAVALPTSSAAYALEMVEYGLAVNEIGRAPELIEADPWNWWQGAAVGFGLGVAVGVYLGQN